MMLTNAVNALLGLGMGIIAFFVGFLPELTLAGLPLQIPEAVFNGLSGLNWFVPVRDLVSIFNWWLLAILAANVAFGLKSAVNKDGKS